MSIYVHPASLSCFQTWLKTMNLRWAQDENGTAWLEQAHQCREDGEIRWERIEVVKYAKDAA